ncbi:MAG: hypothetical protein KGK01_09255 [Bradyrhizobium sp.]|nr:hypothetical protein [Pseudomonadota bacterium]MDE2067879.1 hypothetical protein [Bradyrhizobium sp.]MDE2242611.1 hypothetical protein [Bradyrhizobium sp.]
MEEDLAGFLAQAEEDTTAAADEMTVKVGSAANSMHGYFKGLLVGYALNRVGGAFLGGVESAVSDAAVNPERIAQLTDQINQQKAAIAQHQAELNKWVGTTAQVEVSHYAAATAIASEKDKTIELEQQVQPLARRKMGWRLRGHTANRTRRGHHLCAGRRFSPACPGAVRKGG